MDDTRLTVINARAASQQGATIKPRHKVESVKRVGDRWHASIQSETISCKLVINAAGPWADTVL
ncbi:MAG: FAD-dependent oxidoreductase, partial [Candidatus Puniceispirillaceae bacterium]